MRVHLQHDYKINEDIMDSILDISADSQFTPEEVIENAVVFDCDSVLEGHPLLDKSIELMRMDKSKYRHDVDYRIDLSDERIRMKVSMDKVEYEGGLNDSSCH